MDRRWVYFYADGNVRRGPFTLDQLREHPLRAETMVWREGMPAWSTLRDVPELWAVFAERLVPVVIAPQVAMDESQQVSEGAVPQTPFFAAQVGQTLEYASAEPKPPSAAAVTSLVTGIMGLVWWCLPGSLIVGGPLSIVSIVFGSIGRKKAQRQEAGGAGMALAGLIMGIVNLVIAVCVIAIIGGFVYLVVQSMPPPPATAPATAPALPTTLPSVE